jgi:regulatory protein
MQITALTAQQKDKNRINVIVDGSYRFSLSIFQVGELGIRIGKEYTENELTALETESTFGKLYGRALEYTMLRPHSAKEIRDYLWRKTRATRSKSGEVRKGVSPQIAERVFERLSEKGYIDNEKFTRYWVENRNSIKGISQRKLVAELRAKGIDQETISRVLVESSRSEDDELRKIIAKKRSRYTDEQKFMQYLARQGFGYDDIKRALVEINDI